MRLSLYSNYKVRLYFISSSRNNISIIRSTTFKLHSFI